MIIAARERTVVARVKRILIVWRMVLTLVLDLEANEGEIKCTFEVQLVVQRMSSKCELMDR